MKSGKVYPNLGFEKKYWGMDYRYLAGIDEAGRGPLAGPVAAAAVILPDRPDIGETLHGVQDSKILSAEQREFWAGRIQTEACAWAIAFASVEEIEQVGIGKAVMLAMQRALLRLAPQPDYLLIDYVRLGDVAIPQTSLVKGDLRCLSIAAASILAKTARDQLMCEFGVKYPGYGFAQHKGYATQAHRQALWRLGPCPIHRRNFSPVRALLGGT